MVQRRMLYANLLINEDFAKLSDKGKLLYIGLIVLADDYGRLKVNNAVLRSQIFLYDEEITNKQIGELLLKIAETNLVVLYEDGQYLYHPNWFKWQILRKDRMGKSLCPQPDNQMSTSWQPNDGHLPAEVSKEVSKISKETLENYKPKFLKKNANR